MRKLIAVVGLLFGLSCAAHADTYTTNYNYVMPSTGSTGWGLKLNQFIAQSDTVTAAIAASTFTKTAGGDLTGRAPFQLDLGIVKFGGGDSNFKNVGDAFAPVGLMIDFWADEPNGGEERQIPVVVINDLPSDWQGQLRFRVLKEGKALHEKTEDLEVRLFPEFFSQFRFGFFRIEPEIMIFPQSSNLFFRRGSRLKKLPDGDARHQGSEIERLLRRQTRSEA